MSAAGGRAPAGCPPCGRCRARPDPAPTGTPKAAPYCPVPGRPRPSATGPVTADRPTVRPVTAGRRSRAARPGPRPVPPYRCSERRPRSRRGRSGLSDAQLIAAIAGRRRSRVRGAVPAARRRGPPLCPQLLPRRAHRRGPDRRGLRAHASGGARRQRARVSGAGLPADDRPARRRVLGETATREQLVEDFAVFAVSRSARPTCRTRTRWTSARTSARCTRPSSRWPCRRSAACPSAGRRCCGTPPSRRSRPARSPRCSG